MQNMNNQGPLCKDNQNKTRVFENKKVMKNGNP